MNLGPTPQRLRRLLPLTVALAVGAAAGVGAYALSSHGSSKTTTPMPIANWLMECCCSPLLTVRARPDAQARRISRPGLP